jgi:hypothetical protein
MAQRLLRNIDNRTAIRKANGIVNRVLISCAFPRPNPEAVVQILSKTLVFSRFRGSRRPLGRSWGRQGCCPRGADDLATELPVRCPAGHRRRQGGLGSYPLRPGRQRLSQWPCPAGPRAGIIVPRIRATCADQFAPEDLDHFLARLLEGRSRANCATRRCTICLGVSTSRRHRL